MRGNGRGVGWGGAGSEQKPFTNDLVGLFLSLARSSPFPYLFVLVLPRSTFHTVHQMQAPQKL